MRLDGTMTMRWLVSVCWVLLITIAGTANAILPTAEIEVYVGNDEENSYTVLASQASFGPLSPMAGRTTQDAVQLQFPPSDNPLLCNNDTVEVSVSVSVSVSVTAVVYTEPTILMVPRGDCTYQFKAWQAQQLGAQGVILYNTLASRYSLNTTKSTKSTASTASTATSDDILFPQEFFDYDCQLGQAEIPSVDLSFDPLPYNSQQNDPLLSGDASSDNLCWLYSQNHLNSCDSKKCLITGANTNATFTNKDTDTDTDTDTTQTKVCCAWDLHLWLYSDTTMKDYTKVTIPTVFITMNQADTLFESMSKGPVLVKLYSRWRSSYNLSSILIWMLGVAVASLAAYCSAHDYHTGIRKLLARRNATSSTIPTGRAPRQPQPLAHRNPMQEETLELEPIHALGFVIMASSSLFILFYFEVRTYYYL